MIRLLRGLVKARMAEKRHDHGRSAMSSTIAGVLFIFTLLFWAEDAYAYFDPGTGSMIFQTLLAIFMGIGLAVRQVRDKVQYLLGRLMDRILGRNDEHE